jgi:hypothetical protein
MIYLLFFIFFIPVRQWAFQSHDGGLLGVLPLVPGVPESAMAVAASLPLLSLGQPWWLPSPG